MNERYLITAALPYANGPIHIGHLAGAFLPADIYARYLRMKHKDVLFLSGSDEHGIPITIRARKEGITPQELVDKYHSLNRDNLFAFGINFDIFSRTTSKQHYKVASDFFTNLYNKGVFEEIESEQYYDEDEKQFLADRYIRGTCPKCGYEDAYGDQCEKCGTSLSPNELINPRSALSNKKPILKTTKHWYFPLNKYQEWLKRWLFSEEHKNWKNNVLGQCKSWLEQGLQARAVTRDLDWGVPVPLENSKGKVLYVWFDAPIGYITMTQEWAKENGKDWKEYWLNKDTKLVHFIGKDNIVFHTIMFPTMLKAHGDFILPTNVFANEFMNLEGDKISTSRNHAVWLDDYLKQYPDQQDVLRYVLCSDMPENKDSDFRWNTLKDKNNNELVATFGNLVNRVLSLIQKYYSGIVPNPNDYTDKDVELINKSKELVTIIDKSLESLHFRESLQTWMELAQLGNKYLTETEPWIINKTDPERTKTILYISLQLIARLAITGEPFLPFSCHKLDDMIHLNDYDWNMAIKNDILHPGIHLEQPYILFRKLE